MVMGRLALVAGMKLQTNMVAPGIQPGSRDQEPRTLTAPGPQKKKKQKGKDRRIAENMQLFRASSHGLSNHKQLSRVRLFM